MKPQRIGVLPALIRPIGMVGVLFTAIAIGNSRGCRNLDKSEADKTESPQPVASQEIGYALPPIVIQEILPEDPKQIETITPEKTKNETTLTGLPVIPVTIEELRIFQEAMNTLASYSARAVPDGKRVIFPKEFGTEDAEHIEEGKFGLSPNGKLVNANSEKKKKPASLASVLSTVGKALSRPELTCEEREALGKIKEFLGKHGPFNYDSTRQIMKGLVINDQVSQEEVEKIKERVHEGLIKGLQRLGVVELSIANNNSDE